MASVVLRGPNQYQVTVRQTGYPRQTRTFTSKREAQAWASTVESEMHGGKFVDRKALGRQTFGALIQRYAEEVTPKKRGFRPEQSRIRRFLAHDSAQRLLSQLDSAMFSKYRVERLDEGAADKTVREELLLYSAILNYARMEWSIPIENWVQHVSKPSPGEHRERRLSEAEEALLLATCQGSPTPSLLAAFILALETGMRRGEIAALNWTDVDFHAKVVTLRMTKNGQRRGVPLSRAAEEALRKLAPTSKGKVFSFHDSNGLGITFRRACKRAGVEGFRFHDLRHEAASRFAPHMPVTTLAKLMGWKSIQMAMRYYNPTDSELVHLVRSLEERKKA